MATADGRTPTLNISGAAGSVSLFNERSAYPFPGQTIEREFQARQTRTSNTQARKTIKIFRAWNGAEEGIEFTATLLRTQYFTLRALCRANPPTVSVSYLDESWTGVLTRLTGPPDIMAAENDSIGPKEYVVTGTLLRNST